MSSPIPGTSGSDPADVRHGSAVNPTSALALSGLLKVQRRWSLASLAGLEAGHSDLTNAAYGGLAALDGTGLDPTGSIERRWPVSGAASSVLPTTGRSRLPVHLEDSEWSRLALGVAAEVLASLGEPANADVLQLDPDSVTVGAAAMAIQPGASRSIVGAAARLAHNRLPPGHTGDHGRGPKGRPGHPVRDPWAARPR